MGDDLYRRVDACRVCGSDRLTTVLDLGTPYISDFPLPGETGDRAPLVMARCTDCTLVQTRHTVQRERLFREYWYKSGTNESMVAALRDVVEDACARVALDPDDDVALDIGANDGTLLGLMATHCGACGVDPCPPTSDPCILKGYFPDDWPFGGGQYKVITSVAMFYAQDDPHAFVAAIKRILHPEGIWVVQLQDMASVLRDRAFDYFCHEHLCLYSPASFDALLNQHDLQILDISRNDVNGGSIRFTVGHGRPSLPQALGPEDQPEAWTAFKTDILALKDETVGLLRQLRDEGQLVLGYGASTKGNTLLQFYGLGPDLLPAIAERQQAKWGRQTVTGIPIISEANARAQRPAYFFCLPWHFAAAFERREDVPLILPLPQLEVRSKAKVAA